MSHRFFRYYTFVGHYLLLYGRTNNVVKRRAALCFAACQSKKVLPAWFASVDAAIRIGRRRCINRRVWHPCHTHATSTQPPHAATLHAATLLADCVGMAGMPYPPIDSARGLLLCLTFEHKLVSDIQIAVEIQSGVSVVEVGAGLTAIEEVERTGFRAATAAWLSSCVRA